MSASCPPANCPRCGSDLRDAHGNNNGICHNCIWPVEPWTRHHWNIRVWWPLWSRWRHLQAFRRRCWWRVFPSRRPPVRDRAHRAFEGSIQRQQRRDWVVGGDGDE